MEFSKRDVQVFLLRNAFILLFFLVFITFGILTPKFFQYQTLKNVLTQASYIGIVAMGITFTLLLGEIDLSVGSNMFLSATVAGLLISKVGVPIWVAFLACLATGLLVGAFNAFFIVKVNILSFIVTLSMLIAGRGIGLLFTKSQPIMFPMNVLKIGSYQVFGVIPLPLVIFMLVTAGAYVFLNYTGRGRHIYAIGNNLEAVETAGVDSSKVYVTVYLACGLLAALGGFVSVSQMGIVNAGFAEGYEFNAIAAAILGGTSLYGGRGGVLPGTFLGAVLIQTIQAGLVYLQVDLYIQPLVTAVVIFAAVLIDGLRTTKLEELEGRNIRVQAEEA